MVLGGVISGDMPLVISLGFVTPELVISGDKIFVDRSFKNSCRSVLRGAVELMGKFSENIDCIQDA